MPDNTKMELLELLLQAEARGRFGLSELMPAVRELLAAADDDNGPLLHELREALCDASTPGLRKLLKEVEARQLKECFLAHGVLQAGGTLKPGNHPELEHLPLDLHPGWRADEQLLDLVPRLCRLVKDTAFAARREDLSGVRDALQSKLSSLLEEFRDVPTRWALLGKQESPSAEEQLQIRSALEEFPDQLPSTSYETAQLSILADMYKAEGDTASRLQLLDLLLKFPTPAVCSVLLKNCTGPFDQWRACQVLTLRFGRARQRDWEGWSQWLRQEAAAADGQRQRFEAMARQWDDYLILLQRMDQGEEIDWTSPALDDPAADVTAAGVAARRRDRIAPEDYLRLTDRSADQAESELPEPAPAAPSDQPPRSPKAVPEPPPEPSAWEEHVRPILIENWYMLAGLAMVLIGASLLAYYTWNKHWVIRYTLMPLLMGGFTFGFAALASWLEKQAAEFRTTAILLRAGALGLVPVNFMALCLFAGDQSVGTAGPGSRLVTMGVMTGIYIVVYSFGLVRWCRQVKPSLVWPQAVPLAVLNALVAVAAFVAALEFSAGEVWLWGIVYGGFAVLAAGGGAFLRRVLSRETITDRQLLWFFGGTMILSFVEVFVGLHFFYRILPRPANYAVLVILAGGVVLMVERGYLRLAATKEYREESFLGFAFLLAGILMGFSVPWLRVVVFLLAGAIWLRQAHYRRHLIHVWLGLSFCVLGLAAVGALPAFPRDAYWNPLAWWGLLIVGAIGLFHRVARRRGRQEFATAASDLQGLAVVLTVAVAVMAQWYYRAGSEPLYTAGVLLFLALVFGYRAWQTKQLRWVLGMMAVLVLSLPYLGCINMVHPTVKGNTMVFGLGVLALLWIGFIRWRPAPVLLRARSVVTCALGVMAVSVMVLRLLPDATIAAPTLAHRLMNDGGPFLIAVALGFATWYSRSMLPAMLAAAILAVLFPELKNQYSRTASILGVGSGFGSAVSAVLLLVACYPISCWRRLRQLTDGDVLWEHTPFPLRRQDAALFTLPMALTAFFLAIKVSTWNLLRNVRSGMDVPFTSWEQLAHSTVSLRAAIALLVVGAAWVLLACYFRRQAAVRWISLNAGWMAWLVGAYLLCERQGWDRQWAFLITVFLMIAAATLAALMSRRWSWCEEFIETPLRGILCYGCIFLAGVVLLPAILFLGLVSVDKLAALVLLVLAYFSYQHRQAAGHAFFWLLLFSAAGMSDWGQGIQMQLDRPADFMGFVLLVALLGLAANLITEFRPSWQQRWRAFLQPARFGALLLTGLSAVAFMVNFAGNVSARFLSPVQQAMLLVLLLACARRYRSVALAVLFAIVGYLVILDQTIPVASALDHFFNAFMPWRFALLLFSIVLGIQLVRIGAQRWPRVVMGPGPAVTGRPVALHVLLGFLVLASLGTALIHGLWFFTGEEAEQLPASYLAAAGLLLMYWIWRTKLFLVLAVLIEVPANIHLTKWLYEWARDSDAVSGVIGTLGLSALHVIAAGVALALLQQLCKKHTVLFLVGLRSRDYRELPSDFWVHGLLAVVDRLRQEQTVLLRIFSVTNKILAAAVLGLLSLNYLVDPGVEEMSSLRFVVSGLMALAAALYFRTCSRAVQDGSKTVMRLYVGMYHFGVTMALWCVVLLIPVMRVWYLSMAALMAAPLFFWIKAELTRHRRPQDSAQYCTSAAVLTFVLLLLYVFRPAFYLVLYPQTMGSLPAAWHYHGQAVWILLLGLLAIRLRGLGGTWWLAMHGGVAVMTGAYLILTAWGFPAVSPFVESLPAAWLACLYGHFLIVATHRRSPLRSWIEQLGRLTAADWTVLRRNWGWVMIAAVQALVLLGAWLHGGRTTQVAPLLLFSASVLLYQFAVSGRKFYLVPAAFEFVLALHMDALIPSYLPLQWVIWVLLGLWLAAVVAQRQWPAKLPRRAIAWLSAAMLVAVILHVFLVHHPESWQGLLAFACMGLLAAFTPLPADAVDLRESEGYAGLLLLLPPWLVYFSQSDWQTLGLRAVLAEWPAALAAAALAGVGQFGRWYAVSGRQRWNGSRGSLCLGQQLLRLLDRLGQRINVALLALATAIYLVCIAGVLWRRGMNDLHLLALLLGLSAVMARLWLVVGREFVSRLAYAAVELCVFGALLILRHILWHSGVWNHYYDVWAMLGFSLLFTSLKQSIEQKHGCLGSSWRWTLLLLPVAALSWTGLYGLGADIALVVLGMHGLIFGYLGRERRNSPYNAVAVGAFMSFLLLLFLRLEYRAMHLYIMPVGLAVLALLQLFGRDLSVGLRNRVRMIVLLAMLGSCGWYALTDESFPLAFNLTMIGLCLGVMGLGSFLRIRLYLLLGFTGLIVDLLSLLYKGIIGLQKTSQMVAIGVLLLLSGAIVVVGTVLYKMHQDRILAQFDKWRRYFGSWE